METGRINSLAAKATESEKRFAAGGGMRQTEKHHEAAGSQAYSLARA